MPKAPFRLSKKWLSSPSQRFHGPPRSESQALLRKAFFAFAAHSQGGFRQAARSIRAANPAGRGAHPAGRGAAAFGGRGPLAPGLPNQMAGAGDFGPRPSHLRALRALPPPPPGWPTAKRLCGPAPPGRRYAPCVLLIPPGRHTGPCPWFSRRIGWPGRGSG